MNIAGVEIGPGQPCRVIAEVSNNHNGDLGLALRLIEESAAAGADFVKFQCYTPDELVRLRGGGPAPEPWGSQGWTMRALYEKAQTPHAWFPKLVAKCNEVGVPWFSSVFGYESLDMLVQLRCPAYKVAALDVSHEQFTSLVCDVAEMACAPVIASSRGERIPWADLTLWCKEGYPQDWPDGAVVVDAGLDGLSYHGTDWTVPACAADAGAGMVEVHVQLDDVPSELEAAVSLTMTDLQSLCESVRRGA